MGEWPKRRTLIIGARSSGDFIRAMRVVQQFREDVQKYNQRSGRLHGIAYGGPDVRGIYVWYTTHQLTIYFGD